MIDLPEGFDLTDDNLIIYKDNIYLFTEKFYSTLFRKVGEDKRKIKTVFKNLVKFLNYEYKPEFFEEDEYDDNNNEIFINQLGVSGTFDFNIGDIDDTVDFSLEGDVLKRIIVDIN